MSSRRRTVVTSVAAGAFLLACAAILYLMRPADESTDPSEGSAPPANASQNGGANRTERDGARSAAVMSVDGEASEANDSETGRETGDGAEPERLSLSGRVVDSGGEPIPGAAVRLAALDTGGPRNSRARTDDDGAFAAGNLIAGEWRVAASAPGYRPQSRTVAIPAAEDIEIRLEDDPGFVVVVLDENGNALPDARVAIRSRSLGLPASRSGSTLADGTVRLSGFVLSGGDEWSGELVVRKSGFLSEARTLTTADVDAGRLELTLVRGGELRLRILGADGDPVAGARVALVWKPVSGDSTRQDSPTALRSTPDGDVHFPLLRPGTWVLSVTTTRAGFASPREIAVRGRAAGGESNAEPLEVRLERGPGRIAGRVTNPKGEPIVLVSVRVKPADARAKTLPAPLESVSGEDGTFVFDGVPSGEYDIEVGGGAYAWQRRPGVSSNGEELAFTVVPPGEIFGRVTAAVAMRGYSVRVRGPGYLRTFRFAARRDEFVVRGIPPGAYTVDIVADGRTIASHADVEVRAGERTAVE